MSWPCSWDEDSPKIPGTYLMAWHFVCIFCSVTCQWWVLKISHVSLLPSVTKNLQIIQIVETNLWKVSSIPVKNILLKLLFCNCNISINSKIEKLSVSTHDLHCKHKNKSQSISYPFHPISPSDPIKNSFFIFHFSIKLKFIKSNWDNSHDLCSLLQIITKNRANIVLLSIILYKNWYIALNDNFSDSFQLLSLNLWSFFLENVGHRHAYQNMLTKGKAVWLYVDF